MYRPAHREGFLLTKMIKIKKELREKMKQIIKDTIVATLAAKAADLNAIAYSELEEAKAKQAISLLEKLLQVRDEKVVERIRKKFVEEAIKGRGDPDELKGLSLYSRFLSYLHSLKK